MPTYGGEFIGYTETGEITILPESQRAVFFKADEVKHEVRPANKPRMSIADWLKRV